MGNKCKCGRLKPISLGLAFGVLSGFIMLLLAWWAWSCNCAGLVSLIQQWSNIYPGYAATYIGGLLGLGWGFLQGFVYGVILALLYNLFSCCSSSPCCCGTSTSGSCKM